MEDSTRSDLLMAQQHLMQAVRLIADHYIEPEVLRYGLNAIKDALQAVNSLTWMMGTQEDD